MSHLTYAEAMVIGLIQGVTEMFPVSSLGHSVLIPGERFLGTGPQRVQA
jgi:undecaprenyl-diphosphatase